MNYKQYDIFNNFTNTDKAFNLLKQYYYFLITKELKKVNINGNNSWYIRYTKINKGKKHGPCAKKRGLAWHATTIVSEKEYSDDIVSELDRWESTLLGQADIDDRLTNDDVLKLRKLK